MSVITGSNRLLRISNDICAYDKNSNIMLIYYKQRYFSVLSDSVYHIIYYVYLTNIGNKIIFDVNFLIHASEDVSIIIANRRLIFAIFAWVCLIVFSILYEDNVEKLRTIYYIWSRQRCRYQYNINTHKSTITRK